MHDSTSIAASIYCRRSLQSIIIFAIGFIIDFDRSMGISLLDHQRIDEHYGVSCGSKSQNSGSFKGQAVEDFSPDSLSLGLPLLASSFLLLYKQLSA